MDDVWSPGGHSIVKLNNQRANKLRVKKCKKMYIKHQQNGSNFYQFFSSVNLQGTYYIVKKLVTKYDNLWFFIKHTVSN